MAKRKASSAKRAGKPTQPKKSGRTSTRTVKRAAPSDVDVFIPSAPDDDEDIFVPAGFQFTLPIDPVQGPAPVVVTEPLTLPRGDIDAALNKSFNTSPRLSPGFDERGACLYRCNGMVSLKDPMLGCHEWSCPFWDTAEGVRLMLTFEHLGSDIPTLK